MVLAGSYSRRLLGVLLGDDARRQMRDGPEGRSFSHHWSCGCVASGRDPEAALSLRACADHAVTNGLAGRALTAADGQSYSDPRGRRPVANRRAL